MKIHPAAQGTVDWAIARAGLPTASEFDNLVSPTGKVREGAMPTTYLHRLLAEWWVGGPIVQLNIFDAEQGRVLEEEALPWYSLEHDVAVQRVGLITDDEGTCGCSPDGLLGGEGIEIKCPTVAVHIGYLLKGELPPEYIHQVQGSMFVTGFRTWKFLSYRRRLPKLLLTVDRDDDYQDSLTVALSQFNERLDAAKDRLIELNGGPPKRVAPLQPQPEYASEMPS